MAEHELKTWPRYWDAVSRGEKLFEVRKNDRFFQAGDTVHLLRMADDGGRFFSTEAEGASVFPDDAARLTFTVGPVLQGGQFGIEPGFCVFSLLPKRIQKTIDGSGT